MGKYDVMDALVREAHANELFSERQTKVLRHSLGYLREGLYQTAEYLSTVVVPNDKYGEADFWDWRNDASNDTTLDISVVSTVFAEADFSLAYKFAMVDDMTDEEVRNYYMVWCTVHDSKVQRDANTRYDY